MDLDGFLRARGGAARTSTLRRAGLSSRQLAAALAAGVVLRHAEGLYAVPGCTDDQVARAAVGGVLSCLDAARLHGLAVLRPDPRVHVVAGRGSRRAWPRTVVHRVGLAAGHDDQVALALVPTLRSAARCAPRATAVSLVDEALRTGRVTMPQLLAACPPRDPRWRAVLDAADARAMSGIESLARVELVEALRELGLSVEVQAALRGVGAVDLLVDGWLVVELDGFAFHADRASYREDRRRNQVLSCHGHAWLRFSYEDVVRSRGQLAARVLETWSRGRPPGFASLRTS